eukprot:1157675-Pelagomonas_calceolata.AAC.2
MHAHMQAQACKARALRASEAPKDDAKPRTYHFPRGKDERCGLGLPNAHDDCCKALRGGEEREGIGRLAQMTDYHADF